MSSSKSHAAVVQAVAKDLFGNVYGREELAVAAQVCHAAAAMKQAEAEDMAAHAQLRMADALDRQVDLLTNSPGDKNG